jgi:hypothetical protein
MEWNDQKNESDHRPKKGRNEVESEKSEVSGFRDPMQGCGNGLRKYNREILYNSNKNKRKTWLY